MLTDLDKEKGKGVSQKLMRLYPGMIVKVLLLKVGVVPQVMVQGTVPTLYSFNVRMAYDDFHGSTVASVVEAFDCKCREMIKNRSRLNGFKPTRN